MSFINEQRTLQVTKVNTDYLQVTNWIATTTSKEQIYIKLIQWFNMKLKPTYKYCHLISYWFVSW